MGRSNTPRSVTELKGAGELMNWWQLNQKQWECFLKGRFGEAALWVILESSATSLEPHCAFSQPGAEIPALPSPISCLPADCAEGWINVIIWGDEWGAGGLESDHDVPSVPRDLRVSSPHSGKRSRRDTQPPALPWERNIWKKKR